jgi:hypothetical protein
VILLGCLNWDLHLAVGALVVRWRCGEGALEVRWWCAGGALVVVRWWCVVGGFYVIFCVERKLTQLEGSPL